MPPNQVSVYFSPTGGACLAVLEDPQGDAGYERSLDRQGIAWEKRKFNAKDIPLGKGGGYDAGRVVIRPDASGTLQVEVTA